MPKLLLLRDEVTIVADFGGSPFESHSTRSLIGVDGIELLQPSNVITESVNLAGWDHAFELFNGDTLNLGFEGSHLVVEVGSQTDSILAALVRRDVLVSLRDFDASLEDFLWPLNETHALFGMLLEPGSFRFLLELAQVLSPTGVAATLLRAQREGNLLLRVQGLRGRISAALTGVGFSV